MRNAPLTGGGAWRGSDIVQALAAVYGPGLGAAVWTWLFVSCPHCKQVWLIGLPSFPGIMAVMHAARIIDGSPHAIPLGAVYALGLALSLAIVAGVALVGRRGGAIRWAALAVTTALSALAALAAYALVRA